MPVAFIHPLKNLLSARVTSVVITLVAVMGKAAQKFILFRLDDDKCFQIQAAKNLVAGHGISIHEVFADDLAKAYYTPLIKWPPGYSILEVPLYGLFNNDYFWGNIWLDVIAAAVFVLLARKIIRQLDVPLWLVNIYTFMVGFFLYDFIKFDSSDLVSLVFFLAAVLFTLQFFRSRHKLCYSVLVTFFLFSCCLLRYMYIPVAFIIPFYFVFKGYRDADKKLLRYGAGIILSLALLTGIFLFIQHMQSGAVLYVNPSATGFYPDNLLRTYPFLFFTVLNLELPVTQVHRFTGIDYTIIGNAIMLIHLCILLPSLYFFTRQIFYKQQGEGTAQYFRFAQIAFLSSLAVLGVLWLLSVLYAPFLTHSQTGYYLWTYVLEARYYAAPVFLFQLLFLLMLYRYRIKKRVRALFVVTLSVCMFSSLHGAFFTIKSLAVKGADFPQTRQMADLDSLRMLMRQFVSANKGKNIVCASDQPVLNNFASLWENIPALYDVSKLNDPGKLLATKETVVLAAIRVNNSKRFEGFLQYPSKKLFAVKGKIAFYYFYISPVLHSLPNRNNTSNLQLHWLATN